MAKQPALSTQLKNAQARITELEKKLTDATTAKDRYYRERVEIESELEQVHGILDAIPSAPARSFTAPDAYSATQRKVPARLAAFFAIRT